MAGIYSFKVICVVDPADFYLYIYTYNYLYVTFYTEVEVLKEWDYKKESLESQIFVHRMDMQYFSKKVQRKKFKDRITGL